MMEGMSLAAAARLCPTIDGRQPTGTRLTGWIIDGVRGPTGARVRLTSRRIGGRRAVTRDALKQFLAAVAGEPVPLADEETAGV